MLSLVADYDTTSSSSSSSDEDETENEDTETKKQSSKKDSLTAGKQPSPAILLPSANVLLGSGSSKPAGDVFNNPFLEAEKLEIDKLQKHVKMVESENHLLQKNGRKICWNNRKGRCRFGNKCKYAHDSDLVEAGDVDDQSKPNFKTTANNSNAFLAKAPTNSASSSYAYDDHTNQSSAAGDVITSDSNKNRKRPGLGDSIVPGKRVMKSYQQTNKKST